MQKVLQPAGWPRPSGYTNRIAASDFAQDEILELETTAAVPPISKENDR